MLISIWEFVDCLDIFIVDLIFLSLLYFFLLINKIVIILFFFFIEFVELF